MRSPVTTTPAYVCFLHRRQPAGFLNLNRALGMTILQVYNIHGFAAAYAALPPPSRDEAPLVPPPSLYYGHPHHEVTRSPRVRVQETVPCIITYGHPLLL